MTKRFVRTLVVLATTVGVSSSLLVGCSKVDPGANGTTQNTTGTSGSSTAKTTGATTGASGSTTTDPSTSASDTGSPTPSENAPTVTLSAKSGISAMLPTDSLRISVADGTLKTVSVATKAGTAVEGKLSGDTWKSTRNLAPSTSYVATVTTTDTNGADNQQAKPFATLTPGVTATYSIPYDGATLGVGWPAVVRFDSPVRTPAMQAEVQRNVSIKVTPAQDGAWGWLDSTQLIWRPKNYWKPGTKVTVTANLQGIQTGQNKWVGKDVTGSFTIGDSRISYVNIATHQLRVTKNGATVKTIPITAGRNTPKFTTRSGIKVITERLSHTIMDSSTVDIPKDSPDAYKLDVYWAMRITNTGEFLHAAPWSVGSQGYANVSHGCTGMSTANAKWMFDFSRVGDVVEYTGSSRQFLRGEGMSVWQFSWSDWKAQSAL